MSHTVLADYRTDGIAGTLLSVIPSGFFRDPRRKPCPDGHVGRRARVQYQYMIRIISHLAP
jgi:hypothetical protein